MTDTGLLTDPAQAQDVNKILQEVGDGTMVTFTTRIDQPCFF